MKTPMTTTVSVGDIITVGKSRHPLVVTRSEEMESRDAFRGDFYSVEEFDAIPLNDAVWDWGNETVYFKTKSFYFDDGSMSGQGRSVKRSDVQKVGRAKVRKQVETKYFVLPTNKVTR